MGEQGRPPPQMHTGTPDAAAAVKITATLITLNEEENLPRALSSLGCCDDIVVVDSGSDDRTVEIAREYGARVIERQFSGYADQKNFASGLAQHDWILSLDADEALSDKLEAEVRELKRSGPRADAYQAPRLAEYLGKWIRYSGWYPDPKVRLYNRKKARWVGEYVHEAVEVDGRLGILKGDLLHFTCRSFSEHLATIDRYTTLAAKEIIAGGKRVGVGHLVVSPLWTFLRTYIIKRGFLDGMEGWIIAQMAAFYVFSKYLKARMMSRG
jgi:glycosyltransferase involved in cell wall biosynthesis